MISAIALKLFCSRTTKVLLASTCLSSSQAITRLGCARDSFIVEHPRRCRDRSECLSLALTNVIATVRRVGCTYFEPLSRAQKYCTETAFDAFFYRCADLGQAAIVSLGTRLVFTVRGFVYTTQSRRYSDSAVTINSSCTECRLVWIAPSCTLTHVASLTSPYDEPHRRIQRTKTI
jgi:hypothetical protein